MKPDMVRISARATEQTPAAKTTANLVHVFERDKILPPTEAPTLRNSALAIFNRFPNSNRILLLRKGSTLFLVYEVDGKWHDLSGREMSVSRMERAA